MFSGGTCVLVPALFWLALSTVHSAANSSQLCPTQQPVVSAWPVHSCSIPEGSSVQILVSISGSMTEVCKRNPYTSQCDNILVLNSQKPQYFNSNFEGHITLSDKYFTVENMSKWLEGDYQIKYWNGTITASVSLMMADPTLFSPSTPGGHKTTERSANGTAEGKNSTNSTHYAYLALLVVLFVAVGWVLRKYLRQHGPDGRRFSLISRKQQVPEGMNGCALANGDAQMNGHARTSEHGHASGCLHLSEYGHSDGHGYTSVHVHTDGHIYPNGHGHTNEHGHATVPLSQGAGAELHRLSSEENPLQAVITPS